MTGSAMNEGVSLTCSFDGEFFRAGDTHTLNFTATNNSTKALQGLYVQITSNGNSSITKTTGPFLIGAAIGATLSASVDISIGMDFAECESVSVQFRFQYLISAGVFSFIRLTPFSEVPIFSQQAASPTISRFVVYRCSANGAAQDEGTYARVQVEGATSTAYKLTVAQHALRVGYRIFGSTGNYTYATLSFGTPSISIQSTLSGTFSPGSRYEFVCELSNTYAVARSYAELGKAFANLHLSGSGYGVAVGQYSTATEAKPKFECQYPAHFYGGIYGSDGKEIGAGGVGIPVFSEGTNTLATATSITVWNKTLASGIYLFFGAATFPSNSSGRRTLFLREGGSAIDESYVRVPPVNGAQTSIQTAHLVRFASSTSVDFVIYQNSGSSLSTDWKFKYIKLAD